MNEPLLRIVVIQNLVGAVLFPRERNNNNKKSSVQLKKNQHKQQARVIAARAAGSLSRMRRRNPVPMTTRKRAGNKPFSDAQHQHLLSTAA